MWGRHKKLKEWVAAGVITDGAAQAIEAYEHDRKKGHFGRGLINLSVFAILMGVLSIIASNWWLIPGTVKIGAHILLNLAIGALAVWADKTGRDVWREGAALAFTGLTLTLIILVGQVFQLVGSLPSALAFWMAITFPFFILMGRTYATAVPWMLAFLATIWIAAAEYVPRLREEDQPYFYFGLAALLPLALMADGMIGTFRRVRPALAEVSVRAGAVLSAIIASAAISLWGYFGDLPKNDDYNAAHVAVVLGAGLVAMAVHAGVYGFYRRDPQMKAGALFALVGLVFATVPFLMPEGGNALLSAMAFIAYWMFIGWLGQGMGHMRLVSLAITVIAVRIYIIYVELFGSLFTTGIGLITGGVVMIALIYAARRLNTRIRARGASHGA